MQYISSDPIVVLASFISALLVAATLIMFFLSARKAFWVFLVSAIVHGFVLGSYGVNTYQETNLRNAFIQPIINSFQPSSISDGVELAAMEWDGLTLTHRYVVANVDVIPDQSSVRQQSCSGPVSVSALALGATLEHVYRVEGTAGVRHGVGLKDCFADG